MTRRINVTIPDDWHDLLTERARSRGLSLSDALRTGAAELLLTARERQRLSLPAGPGAPKRAAADTETA